MGEQHDPQRLVVRWSCGHQQVGPVAVECVDAPFEVWSDPLALLSEPLGEEALATGRAGRLHHEAGQLDDVVDAHGFAGVTGCGQIAHAAALARSSSAA